MTNRVFGHCILTIGKKLGGKIERKSVQRKKHSWYWQLAVTNRFISLVCIMGPHDGTFCVSPHFNSMTQMCHARTKGSVYAKGAMWPLGLSVIFLEVICCPT